MRSALDAPTEFPQSAKPALNLDLQVLRMAARIYLLARIGHPHDCRLRQYLPSFETGRMLNQIHDGEPPAANQLLQIVYGELRQLAAAKMNDERTGHTLAPTALVHEAYLRLVREQQLQQWNGRGHFFSAAAEAMRRILIEHARRRNTTKRGGDAKRLDLDQLDLLDASRGPELIALDEALSRLEDADQEAAEIVKLRFFAGMTNEQAAEQVGISPRKANMLWSYARAWLRRAMEEENA